MGAPHAQVLTSQARPVIESLLRTTALELLTTITDNHHISLAVPTVLGASYLLVPKDRGLRNPS